MPPDPVRDARPPAPGSSPEEDEARRILDAQGEPESDESDRTLSGAVERGERDLKDLARSATLV